MFEVRLQLTEGHAVTQLSINESAIPGGFELTGELRYPVRGEHYLHPNGTVCFCHIHNSFLYPILRKKEQTPMTAPVGSQTPDQASADPKSEDVSHTYAAPNSDIHIQTDAGDVVVSASRVLELLNKVDEPLDIRTANALVYEELKFQFSQLEAIVAGLKPTIRSLELVAQAASIACAVRDIVSDHRNTWVQPKLQWHDTK